MSTEWTMRQSLFCLIGSTCLTLILCLGGYWTWSKQRIKKLTSEEFHLTAIIQTGPEKEALKTSLLAEILGLSIDKPVQLYALDLKQAENKLLASPLISSAKVKRLPPSTLYIDYEVRKPVAWLADYKNIGLDKEGYLFPIAPFFSPKNLPEVYLGLPPFGAEEDFAGRKGGTWEEPLKGPHLQLALEILAVLENTPWTEGLRIQRIDVSNAFASSLGQREVVLFSEEEINLRENGNEVICVFPKILRLATKDYPQQLGNFFALRKSMLEDYKHQLAMIKKGGRFAPRIIDLRIPSLAFVEKG